MNLNEARTVAEALIDADIPVFVSGKPGIGKSDMWRQIARDRNMPLIDFRATLVDPVDLRGVPSVSRETGMTEWARPAFLPDEARDGPAGILFMDELNAAPMAVQVACYQLVLDRRIGEHYRLPPAWRIAAAGNNQSDKAGAVRMSTALASRFAHIDVHAEPETAAVYMESIGAPEIAAFIRFRPALLHILPGEQSGDSAIPSMPADAKAFPNPRAYADCAKLVNLPEGVRARAFAARIGPAPAGELESFLRLYGKLPAIATLFADPAGAPVPADRGLLYAVSSAIARHVTRATFPAMLAYAKRLAKEYEIAAVLAATRRDKSLCSAPGYADWALANADVVS